MLLMMKHSLGIIVFSAFSLFAFGQNKLPVNAEGKIVYHDTIALDSVSQAELFDRAYLWFSRPFQPNPKTLQYHSPDKDTLVGSGNYGYIPAHAKDKSRDIITYKIMITLDTGSYSYTIYDFTHHSKRGGLGKITVKEDCYDGTISWRMADCSEAKRQIQKEVVGVQKNLQNFMAVPHDEEPWLDRLMEIMGDE